MNLAPGRSVVNILHLLPDSMRRAVLQLHPTNYRSILASRLKTRRYPMTLERHCDSRFDLVATVIRLVRSTSFRATEASPSQSSKRPRGPELTQLGPRIRIARSGNGLRRPGWPDGCPGRKLSPGQHAHPRQNRTLTTNAHAHSTTYQTWLPLRRATTLDCPSKRIDAVALDARHSTARQARAHPTFSAQRGSDALT